MSANQIKDEIEETVDGTVYQSNEITVAPTREMEQKHSGYFSAIEALTNNPNANPDIIDRMLDAQERILDREAKLAYDKAMVELKSQLPTIIKKKPNNQTKSKYAELGEIKKQVDPLLAKYGFYDSYSDEYPEDGVIITTCTITHRDGHERSNSVRFTRDNVGMQGSKNKTDVHGDASAMTYGQRLSFCRALGIRIADDDDGNAAGLVTITDAQAKEINELIDEVEADIVGFCNYMKVSSVAAIPSKDYQRAISALNAKKTEKNKNA